MDVFWFVYITLAPLLVSGIGVNCPYENCDCYDGTIACDYNGWKTLPELHRVNITRSLFLSLNGNQLTKIQAGALPPNLFGIDFQANPIRTIDQTAFDLSADTLTDLTFSRAVFTELPRALLYLKTLKHLTIADMLINIWDDDVVKYIGLTLETLVLNNVGLVSWPIWIQYLSHLGTLQLTSMRFQVPDNAFNSQIHTLFSLSIKNCSLTEIPHAVSKLAALQTITLDNNNISELNEEFNSANLTFLSLNDNKISDAFQVSTALRPIAGSLTSLQLTNNRLTYMPDLSVMGKLESVYLTHNKISYIANSKVPSSLNFLGLEYNYLPSLYAFIQSGVGLNTLRFHSNFINELRGVDIPVTVSDMDIGLNLIAELTDTSFPSGSLMDKLTLDFNPISKISASAFANLQTLTYLSLMNTRLTRLPLSLIGLSKLRVIEMSQNSGLVCTCLEKSLRNWSVFQKLEIYGDCGVTSIQHFIDDMSVDCPD